MRTAADSILQPLSTEKIMREIQSYCITTEKMTQMSEAAPTSRPAVVGSARDATADPGNTEAAVSSSVGTSDQPWRRVGCQDDF